VNPARHDEERTDDDDENRGTRGTSRAAIPERGSPDTRGSVRRRAGDEALCCGCDATTGARRAGQARSPAAAPRRQGGRERKLSASISWTHGAAGNSRLRKTPRPHRATAGHDHHQIGAGGRQDVSVRRSSNHRAGNNITVDFSGATLQGTDPGADPDQARDTAIVIDGGSNIRINKARIHGYKIGILARGTQQLTLRDNDLSDNWKPATLQSDRARESGRLAVLSS